MKTTGVFKVHKYEILPPAYGKPIYLNPFGDVHFNSPACDKEKFLEWCDEVNKPHHYFLGIGDYLETLSTSERKILRTGDWHDSSYTRIMQMVEGDIKEFCDKIEFMKKKTIGVVNGNHYVDLPSGINSDQKIAEFLQTKFLGVNSLIQLNLRMDKHHCHKIIVCVHHGESGGRTCGSSINKLQRMANHFDADIILQGHDHNRAVDYINRLGVTDARKGEISLENRRILLARTGSFLKGYVENEPSYVVDSALPPCDLGAIKIKITCRRRKWGSGKNRTEKRWVDIEASL